MIGVRGVRCVFRGMRAMRCAWRARVLGVWRVQGVCEYGSARGVGGVRCMRGTRDVGV